ncbi:ATP-binding protein [Methylobacter marinus]|jgi:ATP-dependent DNA helicase RecG|uniref:ATP-binding protein n=1 Tax=Methylobacter marinus TaxID=34058 RepID=UPI00036463A6|nr:ATP-binding protein [Methylobacter marinus]
MSVPQSQEHLSSLLRELCKLPKETEWVEFKHSNDDPQMIGEYISALANSAALLGKQSAYIVWGIADEDHALLGTNFKPSTARHKQQELENWLLQKVTPKIHFQFLEFEIEDKPFVILEIAAANHTPVQFDGTEYIRIGSYKKKLRDHSAKERELWRTFDRVPFEQQRAAENQNSEQVLKRLDYPSYFDLTNLPLPDNRTGILDALEADRLIVKTDNGHWHISNLGAVLFAKQLNDFPHLARKAVRVILYKGSSRVETIREIGGNKGYASGFERLIGFINNLLPENEVIGQALRKSVPMFPELAIRELVANAIIHQDFTLSGTGPMIEIFSDRMEITNPGIPLVDTQRFLDSPPRSRNEGLASFLRRIGICEERGSGIDKVVFQTEVYQLPAPAFEVTQEHTRAVLFGHKEFKDMDKEDRIRACYQHCCLKYVNREPMNNTSLRERLGVEVKNSAMVSRIIKQAVEAAIIRPYDPDAGTKAMRYIPFWA